MYSHIVVADPSLTDIEKWFLQTPRNPDTILELAYIQDPKLFDRDGQTRRSKARADLKAQTGYTDEQIEGWKIMLERDVRCALRP